MRFFRIGIIKSLLILFFAVHFISIAFFTHAHTVENRILIHSHPFNPFSEKSSNHDHSDKEFFHVELLSHLDVLPALNIPYLSFSSYPQDTEIHTEFTLDHNFFRSFIFLLRAPPAIS